MFDFEPIGISAREASRGLASAGTEKKNEALRLIARELISRKRDILDQNRADVKAAEAKGVKSTLTDRLYLNEKRIEGIAEGVLKVADLGDPVGEVISGETRPNGLRIKKVRVPLGVVGIIYESRPNVTVDAAALCLKSGNAAILRGGSDAIGTNIILAAIMRDCVKKAGLPENAIQLLADTSHESANALMHAHGLVDVLIPRGGAGLIRSCVENSTVPVIETGVGNCHIYVDSAANINMAVDIIDNAKTQRPGVCNACETVLVHRDIAEELLPKLKKRLDAHRVEIRGCKITKMILGSSVTDATEEDWATEYLDYILAVKVVDNIFDAIEHIRKYSTGHSECIVTDSLPAAEEFTSAIDAAAVYVNASTRFTDGFEFGLGAEIGISTAKLHARGPMGLRELTTVKYIINGSGQIRQ